MDKVAGLELLRRVCLSGRPPQLSPTLQMCLELARDPQQNPDYLGETIAGDDRLTLRLLMIANAITESGERPMTRPIAVVDRLGAARVGELLWLIAICDAIEGNAPRHSRLAERLLQHSLLVGLLTESLMTGLGVTPDRYALPAGAAHDLGHSLLGDPTPELAFDWHLEHEQMQRQPNLPPEKDHCLIGASLLAVWDAPQELIEVALHHHNPADAGGACEPLVLCVRLADVIADFVDSEPAPTQSLVLSTLPEWDALLAMIPWENAPDVDLIAAEALTHSADAAERLTALLIT